MAKRLKALHKKMARDQARAYKENPGPWKHKVASRRSKKHLFRNARTMA
jgi:hypothetical protein